MRDTPLRLRWALMQRRSHPGDVPIRKQHTVVQVRLRYGSPSLCSAPGRWPRSLPRSLGTRRTRRPQSDRGRSQRERSLRQVPTHAHGESTADRAQIQSASGGGGHRGPESQTPALRPSSRSTRPAPAGLSPRTTSGGAILPRPRPSAEYPAKRFDRRHLVCTKLDHRGHVAVKPPRAAHRVDQLDQPNDVGRIDLRCRFARRKGDDHRLQCGRVGWRTGKAAYRNGVPDANQPQDMRRSRETYRPRPCGPVRRCTVLALVHTRFLEASLYPNNHRNGKPRQDERAKPEGDGGQSQSDHDEHPRNWQAGPRCSPQLGKREPPRHGSGVDVV